MSKITVILGQSGEWGVVTNGWGAYFSDEHNAREAARLCEASYRAGRQDHTRDLNKLLSEG